MENFDYLQDLYTNVVSDLLDSNLSINATINIAYTIPQEESTNTLPGNSLDSRQNESIKRQYPYGLQHSYRVRVFPIEQNGLKTSNAYIYSREATQKTYDMWVSCIEKNIKVSDTNNLFDFAKNVTIKNVTYEIKGVVRELFGTAPMIHIFLDKETNG